MPKIPGVNHLRAIKAFEKEGFRAVRQGKHIVMSDGTHFITIPRHNPVNAITMGGIVKTQDLQRRSSRICSDQMEVDAIISLPPHGDGGELGSSRRGDLVKPVPS